MKTYNVLGLMSGTSLDGLDLALCAFSEMHDKSWQYSIVAAETVPYDTMWEERLRKLHLSDAETYIMTDAAYGALLADEVLAFLHRHSVKASLIASHGHTIFHNPASSYSAQIGKGAVLAARTGITTVSDFRSTDVAMGGQGAPLVPAGDKLLFPEYTFCLNLGGFSNISYDDTFGLRRAFDICPVNFVLNKIFRDNCGPDATDSFDRGGQLAAQGQLDKRLFDKLAALPYYHSSGPKSLGREWVETEFFPLCYNSGLNASDLLHTLSHHMASEIARVLHMGPKGKVLVTGGGAHNDFLIKLIQQYAPAHEIVVPDQSVIDYKEALIFAFLGLLRLLEKPNCLSSVTGARVDSCSGALYSVNGNTFNL